MFVAECPLEDALNLLEKLAGAEQLSLLQEDLSQIVHRECSDLMVAA
jgi:hypothetical protein